MRLLRGAGRGLCTAAPKGPRLPQWGSFGKSQPALESLVSEIKEANEREVSVIRGYARTSARFVATMSMPRLWFDSEARDRFHQGMEEGLDRYARINHRLLHGCEYAYRQLADEWTRPDPEWDGFVKAGALDPKIARVLREGAARYRSAGLIPTLRSSRVSPQVLYVSTLAPSSAYGDGKDDLWLAHVIFRTREERGVAPFKEGVAPVKEGGGGDQEGEAGRGEGAVAGGGAEGGVAGEGEAGSDAAEKADVKETGAGDGGSQELTPPPRAGAAAAGDTAGNTAGGNAAGGYAAGGNAAGGNTAGGNTAGADSGVLGAPAGAAPAEGAGGVAMGGSPPASTGAARDAESAGPSISGASDSGSGDPFEESIQIWTFAAEPPIFNQTVAYLGWLRASTHAELGGEEEPGAAPVKWKLVDINYTVAPFTPPELSDPDQAPAEVARMLGMAGLTLVAVVALAYRFLSPSPRPPVPPADTIPPGGTRRPPQPPYGGAPERQYIGGVTLERQYQGGAAPERQYGWGGAPDRHYGGGGGVFGEDAGGGGRRLGRYGDEQFGSVDHN